MSVNWKKLKDRIPHSVQIKGKKSLEVLWVDDFKDGETLGEMRPHHGQIVIKKNEPAKLTVVTYLHELAHAISDTYELGLSESKILQLEKAFYFLLKEQNVFKSE